jgi:hypothetical protein
MAHPHLAPKLRKGYSYNAIPLWAFMLSPTAKHPNLVPKPSYFPPVKHFTNCLLMYITDISTIPNSICPRFSRTFSKVLHPNLHYVKQKHFIPLILISTFYTKTLRFCTKHSIRLRTSNRIYPRDQIKTHAVRSQI